MAGVLGFVTCAPAGAFAEVAGASLAVAAAGSLELVRGQSEKLLVSWIAPRPKCSRLTSL